MTFEEIQKAVRNGIPVFVTIQDESLMFAENFFADNDMEAKVKSIHSEGNDVIMDVELEEFEEYNKTCMTNEWSDGSGNHNQNYLEYHGSIPKKETIGIYKPDLLKAMEFKVRITSFKEEFLKDEEAPSSYVQWLEEELGKTREALECAIG